MIINKQGHPLPQEKPEKLLVEKNMRTGQLFDCKIEILKRIDNAVPRHAQQNDR